MLVSVLVHMKNAYPPSLWSYMLSWGGAVVSCFVNETKFTFQGLFFGLRPLDLIQSVMSSKKLYSYSSW